MRARARRRELGDLTDARPAAEDAEVIDLPESRRARTGPLVLALRRERLLGWAAWVDARRFVAAVAVRLAERARAGAQAAGRHGRVALDPMPAP